MKRLVGTFSVLAAVAAALVLFLLVLAPAEERAVPVPPPDELPAPAEVPAELAPPPGPDLPPVPEPPLDAPAEEGDLLTPPCTRGAVPRDGPVLAKCSGRVLDLATGQPVPRFLLRFGTKARREGDPEDVRIFRDGTGGFRVDDLRFVPETMEVRALLWDPARVSFAPPEGKPWVLFLERKGFTVRGLLVDAAGAPVPGHCASVHAELQGADALAARAKELRDAGEAKVADRLAIHLRTGTMNQPDGAFRLLLRCAGTYKVTGEYPLGTVEERVVALGPDSPELVLAATGTSGGLRITGGSIPADTWIEGMRIDIDGAGDIRNSHVSFSRGSTSYQGGYPPGKRTLLFYPAGSGFRPWRAEVAFETGRWTDLDFDYQPGASLRGWVVDAAGFPAEGLDVEARWPVAEANLPKPEEGTVRGWGGTPVGKCRWSMTLGEGGLSVGLSIKTGPGGRFEFPGLAGVPSSLLVKAGACGQHEVRLAETSGDMEVRLPFPMNKRLFRLRLPADHGYPFLSLTLHCGERTEYQSVSDPGSIVELSVPCDPRLPMYVEVQASDWRSNRFAMASIQAPEGKTSFEADLALHAPASVRLALVDSASGSPVDGSVFRMRGSTHIEGRGPVADDGVVLFEKVPPGEYEFAVSAPGCETDKFLVRLEPGEAKDLGTIRLRRTPR